MATILVVDDSETLRNQIKMALEGGGFKVIEGVDGQDGLDKIEKNLDICLILCDVNMPRMDGLTMCQKLSENPKHKKIPILMLTTEASPEMKTKAKAAGVIAWITKPFVESKLVDVIKKVLGNPS